MSDLEQELREAIEAQVDPATQPRLLKVLPSLLEGVASWRGPTSPFSGRDTLYVAAAMPESCIVFAAEVWPTYDEQQAAKLSKGDLASVLCSSLILEPTDAVTSNILTALAVLMGPEGLEQQQRDAQRIRSCGGVPLVAALLDRQGDSVAILVTTVTVLRPTVH
jgi:hypothetical protein